MEKDITPDELNNLTVVENGNVTCCIALLFTLYFENGHSAEKRQAVIQCHEEYWQTAASHIRWMRHPYTAKPTDITKTTLPSLKEWESQLTDHDDLEIMYHGGTQKSDASPYSFKVLAIREEEAKLSYLSATLPILWIQGRPAGSFLNMVHGFCNKLQPYHGYAGFAAVSPVYYWDAIKSEFSVYLVVQRFPGLEVDYPTSHARHLESGIKGVNWLTILADKWVERAGGRDYLRANLDTSFAFYDYPGGLMIQAGPFPQLGDVNRKNIPEHYQKLSRLLKKIRVDYPDVLQADSRGFNMERTKKWFNRFD